MHDLVQEHGGTHGAGACPAHALPGLREVMEGYTSPHGLYDALRGHDAIRYDAASRAWLVTGQGAVRTLLSDPRFVSDATMVAPAPRRAARRSFVADAIQKQVIFCEGPRQARIQRAVLVELSRRSESLTGPLRAAALDLAERARARGEVDLVTEFAVPFSMTAITLVLGLPVEDDAQAERLERWSTTFGDVTSGYLHGDMEDIIRLGDYFRAQVAARRGEGGDDLIGAFLRDGGLDDEDDVVIQCMMAYAAGRVTTQKLLASGIPLLLPQWGAWRDHVRENPGVTRRLTEELLRVVTPTRYVARYALEDCAIAGASGQEHAMRRGDKVILFLEAANRDPEAFPDPHALQAARQPNPHVSFGFGQHRCPGASVARIEIQAALQALLETLSELRPNPAAPPTWDPNPNLGGYASFRCLCA